MSIAFVTGGLGPNNSSTSTTLSLGTPGNGHLLIAAFIQCITGATLSAPAGWTVLANTKGAAGAKSGQVLVCYKIWLTGDSTSAIATSTGTQFWESAYAEYSGTDTTNPIDTSAFCVAMSNVNLASHAIAPSINPNFNNEFMVAVFAVGGSSGFTITNPSGLTSRESTGSGPNVLISDKTLTTGANTGNFLALGDTANNVAFGMQLGIKPASAVAATVVDAVANFAGVYDFHDSGSTSIVSFDISTLGVANGDLVCAFLGKTAGSAWTPPSGYATALAETDNTSLYTHSWGTGDATSLTFTNTSGNFHFVTALVIRGQGASAVNPYIDQVSVQSASGTVSTGALTLATPTSDLLVEYFGEAVNTTSGTWTNPATATTLFADGFGPSHLLAFEFPVTSPTTARTAVLSSGQATAAFAVAVSAKSGADSGTIAQTLKQVTQALSANVSGAIIAQTLKKPTQAATGTVAGVAGTIAQTLKKTTQVNQGQILPAPGNTAGFTANWSLTG